MIGEDLKRFYDDVSKGYDWYDSEIGTKELFEKTKNTTEALGIEWYYICERDSNVILGKLGYFESEGAYRLQDIVVDKAHRRQKLATFMVSFVIQMTLAKSQGSSLCLIADHDYYAIDLYKKMGFEIRGYSVCLMDYPVN